ncbi:NADH dehydrogenase [ubiquinone] 1 alpha subcomplex assembly factor 5 [Clonorchis sinensis]|uniref:NADH dehydrogenase [ubiquinone] 1 alpha subcomplex assembly factor 5 n=1 Tax=Clonorchis sinensis TaxID=79923 RepID=A0A3R7FP68_CLOSI|nr:NADH dehydrogenase [ubiquinone] 1 alpha subcomplex assembly factor 5 [Clonorchis sinensis]
MAQWLEREFTDRKIRSSNPTFASRLPLSRLGRPGSIPALVLPLGDLASRHQKGFTAERHRTYIGKHIYLPSTVFSHSLIFCRTSVVCAAQFHSSTISGQNVMYVFDRCTKLKQRIRSTQLPNPHLYEYVREEIASRLADRVCDISRKFAVAVDLGCGRGHLSRYLTTDSTDLLFQCDSSIDVLLITYASVSLEKKSFSCNTLPVPSCHAARRKHESWDTARLPKPRQGKSKGRGWVRTTELAVGKFALQPLEPSRPANQCSQSADVPTGSITSDEEALPFRNDSLDLVLTCLSLHWVNDLPGILRHVFRALKSDGCFLGVMSASDTLFELRLSLQLAELERLGGFAPHVSPFADNVDMGELLHRTGFNLITLDVEELVVHYPNMFCLMDDLRGMGESNAIADRPVHIHRDVLLAASAIYDEKFGVPREGGNPGERCIPATYRLLYFIGWKPHPSQRQPLPPGSAKFSLKDIHRVDELQKELEERMKNSGDVSSQPPDKSQGSYRYRSENFHNLSWIDQQAARASALASLDHDIRPRVCDLTTGVTPNAHAKSTSDHHHFRVSRDNNVQVQRQCSRNGPQFQRNSLLDRILVNHHSSDTLPNVDYPDQSTFAVEQEPVAHCAVLFSCNTPIRCLAAMPPGGSTRAGILPGCPSLDRGSREAEAGFESRTFRSGDSRSNHLSYLAPVQAPFQCLAAVPPEGSTRVEILPGFPSLDRRIREAEVRFEPQTFRLLGYVWGHFEKIYILGCSCCVYPRKHKWTGS